MNIAVLCAEADNIKIRKYLDMFDMKCGTDNEISTPKTVKPNFTESFPIV